MQSQKGAIQDWRRKNKYKLAIEDGKLMSVTEVGKSTRRFAKDCPYWVGIIELTDGSRVVGQLVRKEGWVPKIGDLVSATRRIWYRDGKRGVIHYGIKWRRG